MSALLKSTKSATSWDPSVKDFVEDLRQILKNVDGKKVSSAQIFLLGMSFGFAKQAKGPKPPNNNDAVRLEYLREDEVARMRMVAIAEAGSSDILESDEQVIEIAEQYANGGLALLKAEKESNPAFQEWLVSQLYLQIESWVSSHGT